MKKFKAGDVVYHSYRERYFLVTDPQDMHIILCDSIEDPEDKDYRLDVKLLELDVFLNEVRKNKPSRD